MRFLALFCAILLTFSLPFSILTLNVHHLLFNPPLMKDVLTHELVDSDLFPAAMAWFAGRINQGNIMTAKPLAFLTQPTMVKLLVLIDQETWRRLQAEALTEDILREWVSSALDATYAWIDNSAERPELSFDLEPLKQRLSSQAGVNCVLLLVEKMPPCSNQDIVYLQNKLITTPTRYEVIYPPCNYPEPWHVNQSNSYLTTIQRGSALLPSEFNLLTEQAALTNEQAVSQSKGGLPALKQLLYKLRLVAGIAWVLPLSLLALLTLLTVRSWKDLARWWGAPLLVAGMISLLIPLLHRPLLKRILSAGFSSSFPPIFLDELINSLTRLSNWVFLPLMFEGLALVLVGLGLLVWLDANE